MKSYFYTFIFFTLLTFACQRESIEVSDDDLSEGWTSQPTLSNNFNQFRQTLDSSFGVKKVGDVFKKGQPFNYGVISHTYNNEGKVIDLQTNDLILPLYDGSIEFYGNLLSKSDGVFRVLTRFAKRVIYSYNSKGQVIKLRFFDKTTEFGQNTIEYDESNKKIIRKLDVLNNRDSLSKFVFEYDYQSDNQGNIISEKCINSNLGNMTEREKRGLQEQNFYYQYDSQNRVIEKITELLFYNLENQGNTLRIIEKYEYKANMIIKNKGGAEVAYDEQGNFLYQKGNSGVQNYHFVAQYRKHDKNGNWTERITFDMNTQSPTFFTQRKIVY